MPDLVTILVTDIREGGPVQHALLGRQRARALRNDCVSWLPGLVQSLLPAMDTVTRRWLERSPSPYVAEIKAIAAGLAFPGIWFLNGSYQWGCTAVARDEDGAPWLARTLDWPFPGVGRHVEVAQMRGRAGEFLSVTWPGYVGTLTAMAPGRFAAAINQAPLWRRTRKPWLRPFDIACNAVRTWGICHAPPDHVLREVFETCGDYGEARRRLEREPLARPAIFTLVGCAPGERCVIERTENDFVSRDDETYAANDWHRDLPRWEARVSSKVMLTRTFEEAAENTRKRREALAGWPQPFGVSPFDWVTPPVLNAMTRIAVEMCPANGTLRLVGFELDGGDVAQRATDIHEMSCAIPRALSPAS